MHEVVSHTDRRAAARRLRWPYLLAAVLALDGCAASPQPTVLTPPVTMASTEAVSTTFSARHQATVAVANADGLIAFAGALWVKTDDGRVVRIDPATNRVTRTIAVDDVSDRSSYCQGIGTDGKSIWACMQRDDGTSVAQIDPTAARVARRWPAGKAFDQLKLPVTSRGIWVLTADGANASVVDPSTGRVTVYPLGHRYQQLDVVDDRIVATSAAGDELIVVEAAGTAAPRHVSLSSPRLAVQIGMETWVDTTNGLTRLAQDLSVRAVYRDLVAGLAGDLVAAANSLWHRAADGTVTRIDPVTGRIVERITPTVPLTAGSMLIAFDSIWLTSGDDGTVVRLRLRA